MQGLATHKRPIFIAVIVLAVVTAILLQPAGRAFAQDEEVQRFAAGDTQACLECHGDVVDMQAFAASPHGGNDCQSCHEGITQYPHPAAAIAQKPSCESCHADKVEELAGSVHGRPDGEDGDHPTCVSCHGGNAHAINTPATAREKLEQCADCHNDAKRMGRYGLTTGAYTSYLNSFHGKALARFHQQASASCADCHGAHDVKGVKDPAAPTSAAHIADTCGKCHAGAKMNFAMSGANHLDLRIKKNLVLNYELKFFRLLIFGTMFFLLGMVCLDLRRKLFSPQAPECGRATAILIALSFVALIAGIVLAYLRVRVFEVAWLAAFGLMVLAFIVYRLRARRLPSHQGEKHYARINGVFRLQHFLLFTSFTTLVLTGFPLHFAQVEWTHHALALFGGFQTARLVHRVAGVIMVVNWVWHLTYLLYLWKKAGFTIKSMSMLPTWKDVTDFIDTIKYGLGLRNTPPQFGRFQFREKFDYFADMWGTLVMGASGLILWFPVALGNKLPDLAFGVSYIAHSYEGMLAVLAIIIWHFYNAHFNPDQFPMNPAWLTGALSASEMAREHPLEKAALDQQPPAEHPTAAR